MDKLSEKNDKETGLSFYCFQNRDAQQNDTAANCYKAVLNKKHKVATHVSDNITIHWAGMELDNFRVNKLRNQHT
ncbi:hypothetical protein CTI12_AA565240 [Artemisia annua]|uniref:Uncharacterized protein n=1 Tax=Artemisia annua TaxID=35608 RepID=A0A2U1KTP4_ARTAN|nr:hypothetical protein CTI12_AA565240 [Artemisia annua]